MRTILCLLLILLPASLAAAQRVDGQLKLEIVDAATGEPMAARVELKNARGRAYNLPPNGQLRLGGSFFYVEGALTLSLPLGQYTLAVEAGPEYRTITANFEIFRNSDDSKRIEMKRGADLAAEGWWAGDIDAEFGDFERLPTAMRAERLHALPLVAWSGDGKTFVDRVGSLSRTKRPKQLVVFDPRMAYGFLSARDDSAGGGLLMIGAKQAPANWKRTSATTPTSLATLEKFHGDGATTIARVPYAWDLPVWLASGKLDAIEVIHSHARRNMAVDDEKDGRPRDRALYGSKAGNGRWSEDVYFHVLNCGLRIPPVAGGGEVGADETATPIGTNRVYVDCGDEFSFERWLEGLVAGRVFVTNGPLLRPRVSGHSPGHVFQLESGGELSFEVGVTLSISSPVEYLEVVKNGQVHISERLSDWKNKQGRLPPLAFDDSGWFSVRAVTTDNRKYQFALTGPYYVEKSGQPRISKKSVQFFLDWIAAASERTQKLPGASEGEKAVMLAEQAKAKEFFNGLLSKANAE